MSTQPDIALERLGSIESFGTGEPTGKAGDDRRGHFWLITDKKVLLAVKIALTTGRPLLVEGPSGAGKSALARAVSETLGWTYYETVITSHTRLDHLTGWVDLVQRLHEAGTVGPGGRATGADPLPGLDAFVRPGVLWWALDPGTAVEAGRGGQPDPGLAAREPVDDGSGGAVVLIDEIDKAEPDVPNNLLVPLGSWELRVEGRNDPVRLERPRPPLVIITSNHERDMPPAFLRRCVAVELGYPTRTALVQIAVRHLGIDDGFVELVARRLVLTEMDHQVSPAEFVDAVRAAQGLGLTPEHDSTFWEAIRSIVLEPSRLSGPE